MSAPPVLPRDFEQDYERTTSSAIGLNWTYDPSATRFDIYRYYDFPEGGGPRLVGSVSASDYQLVRGEDGQQHRRYRFSDDRGLAENSDYRYRLQVVRNKIPPISPYTSWLSASTKSTFQPKLSVSPTSLTVYPDRSGTLVADVDRVTELYVDKTAYYQWQRKDVSTGSWKNVSGATNAVLLFSAATTDTAGLYRCRVNAITAVEPKNTAITAYTEAVHVRYAQRDTSFGPIEAADTADGGTLVSVAVRNAHSDSGSIPSGRVHFTFRRSGSSRSFTANAYLDASGRAEVEVEAVPEGLYSITALYDGDRVFAPSYARPADYLCRSDFGYRLALPETVTYGNEVEYSVVCVSRDEPSGSVSARTVTPTSCQIYLNGSEVPVDGAEYRSQDPGRFYAAATGDVRLVVGYQDTMTGRTGYTEGRATIGKRPVTLAVPDFAIKAGAPYIEPVLRVVDGEILAADAYDVFTSRESVSLRYWDAAGREVPGTSLPSLPGHFDVSAEASKSLAANYDATIFGGTYSVVGWIEWLYAGVRPFEGHYPGALAIVSPSDMATAGDQQMGEAYPAGTRVTFSAFPDPGYVVYDWYVNDKPQGKPALKFDYTMLAEPAKVEVQYVVAPHHLTYATAGPQGAGTVQCGLASGCIARRGLEVTMTATPSPGYHFVEWQYTEESGTTTCSAGVAGSGGSSAYQFVMPSKSVTVRARFERDSYTLTLLDPNLEAIYLGDADHNSATPDVPVTVTSPATIVGDTTVTVRPKLGYAVPAWASWVASPSVGVVSADKSSYTLVMTQNTAVKVIARREMFTVLLGFAGDPSDASTSTVTYWLDDPVTDTQTTGQITAGGGAVAQSIEVRGGSRLRVALSLDREDQLSRWQTARYVDPAETEIDCGPVGSSFSLLAQLEAKPKWPIVLGALPGRGATYQYSATGDATQTISAEASHAVQVLEGSTLSVHVTPPLMEVVGWWRVDQAKQVAASNTFVFADVREEHVLLPELAPAVFWSVTWPGVSAAENGVTLVPDGCLPFLRPGGEFRFRLDVDPEARGIAVNSVTANQQPVPTDPDDPGLYVLSDINENTVISVALKPLGVAVNGVDVANVSGSGWKYDVIDRQLTLSRSGLTLSGAMIDSNVTFSVLLDSNVWSATLSDFMMTAEGVRSAMTSRRQDGIDLTVRGSNQVELVPLSKLTDSSVLSCQGLRLTRQSSGTIVFRAAGNASTPLLRGISVPNAAGVVTVAGGKLQVSVQSPHECRGISIFDPATGLPAGEMTVLGNPEVQGATAFTNSTQDGSSHGIEVASLVVAGGSSVVYCGVDHTQALPNATAVVGRVSVTGGDLALMASSNGRDATCIDARPGVLAPPTGTDYAVNISGGHLDLWTATGWTAANTAFGARGRVRNTGGAMEVAVQTNSAQSTARPLSDLTLAEWERDPGMVVLQKVGSSNAPLTAVATSTAGLQAYLTSFATPARYRYLEVCPQAGAVTPENVGFAEHEARSEMRFVITCPRDAAAPTVPIRPTIVLDDEVLTDSTRGVIIDDTGTGVVQLLLGTSLLNALEAGVHTLRLESPGNPVVSSTIEVWPTGMAPRVPISSSPPVALRGGSVRLTAGVPDDARLVWSLNGATSSTIEYSGFGPEATLNVGADETASELQVALHLVDEPNRQGTLVLPVEDSAEAVTVTPASVVLEPAAAVERSSSRPGSSAAAGGS